MTYSRVVSIHYYHIFVKMAQRTLVGNYMLTDFRCQIFDLTLVKHYRSRHFKKGTHLKIAKVVLVCSSISFKTENDLSLMFLSLVTIRYPKKLS